MENPGTNGQIQLTIVSIENGGGRKPTDNFKVMVQFDVFVRIKSN